MTTNEIIISVTGLIGSVTTFFVGSKGRTKQLDSLEIKNLTSIIKVQSDSIIFIGKQTEELRMDFVEMQKDFEECKKNLTLNK